MGIASVKGAVNMHDVIAEQRPRFKRDRSLLRLQVVNLPWWARHKQEVDAYIKEAYGVAPMRRIKKQQRLSGLATLISFDSEAELTAFLLRWQ